LAASKAKAKPKICLELPTWWNP